MPNPALRSAALNAFTDETTNVQAAAAAAASDALPANITARRNALQGTYTSLTPVMSSMIDALNFALASTGGITGVITAGVVGTNVPFFTLGASGKVAVALDELDVDGITPIWRTDSSLFPVQFRGPTLSLLLGLARFYARVPSAAT